MVFVYDREIFDILKVFVIIIDFYKTMLKTLNSIVGLPIFQI